MIRHVADIKINETDEALDSLKECLRARFPNRVLMVTWTSGEIRWPWRRARYAVVHVYELDDNRPRPTAKEEEDEARLRGAGLQSGL